MSSSPPPADNSVELAKLEAEQARQAREEQAAKDAATRSRFESGVNTSYNSAIDDAKNYFLQHGLDPNDYMAAIQSGATRDRNNIPDLAAAPGTYFDNLGATVFNSEQEGKRAQLQRQINQFAPSGFETRRIGDTSDDATLAAILQEQRGTADQYIRNLLDRGVINSSGYSAAEKDLDTQSYGAKARLEDVGNQQLQKGRSGVTNIANTARSGAANYNLGDTFDPYSYSTDIDNSLSSFFSSLGGNIRGALPSNLFTTTGLAGLAGAAMGPQNLKFDPAAVAGVKDPNDTTDDADRTSFLSAF